MCRSASHMRRSSASGARLPIPVIRPDDTPSFAPCLQPDFPQTASPLHLFPQPPAGNRQQTPAPSCTTNALVVFAPSDFSHRCGRRCGQARKGHVRRPPANAASGSIVEDTRASRAFLDPSGDCICGYRCGQVPAFGKSVKDETVLFPDRSRVLRTCFR
jgi:hypothetical protein